jgi:hypothetical protein
MLPPQRFRNGLSWRVAILPYIEQDQLYRQFKLDEPWDSPHNKKLIPLMPKLYESVGTSAQPGFTYIQTFVGANTINKDVTKGMRFPQMVDGTSNTLLVAEGAMPVEWTRPDDIQVQPSQPIRMGAPGSPFLRVVFADGTVSQLPRQIDQQTLRWLIDPADGNVVNIPR